MDCNTEQLKRIERKLDELDAAIRGNGRPGLNVRIDRLERAASSRSKVVWNIIVPLCVAVLGAAAVTAIRLNG